MPANHAVENVLGTLGAVLWSIQLFPQLIKSYKRKTTDGLHPTMMILWSCASVILGAYVIVQGVNIPLIVQPQSMGALCALCAAQRFYYDLKTPLWKVTASLLVIFSIAAGVEVGLVYAARAAEDRGISGFTTFLGVASVVMINSGFPPQIWLGWKHKEVFGISFIFLAVDALGGIVSALSLAFATEAIDGLTCASYIGPPFFEFILFGMALYLNPRARRRRVAESATGPLDEEGRVEETLEEKREREGLETRAESERV